MRIASLVVIAGCTTVTGQRVLAPTEDAAQVLAGIPYHLPRPVFEVTQTKGNAQQVELTVRYVPDPGSAYTVNISPATFANVSFETKFRDGGTMASMSGGGTDQVGPAALALGQLALSVVGYRNVVKDIATYEASMTADIVTDTDVGRIMKTPAHGMADKISVAYSCVGLSSLLDEHDGGLGGVLHDVLNGLQREYVNKTPGGPFVSYEDADTGKFLGYGEAPLDALSQLIRRVAPYSEGKKVSRQIEQRLYVTTGEERGWLLAAARFLHKTAQGCADLAAGPAAQVCSLRARGVLVESAAITSACGAFEAPSSPLVKPTLPARVIAALDHECTTRKKTWKGDLSGAPQSCVNKSPLRREKPVACSIVGSPGEDELKVLCALREQAKAASMPPEDSAGSFPPVRFADAWRILFRQRLDSDLKACSPDLTALVRTRQSVSDAAFKAFVDPLRLREGLQQAASKVQVLASMNRQEWARRYVGEIERELAAIEVSMIVACREGRGCTLPHRWQALNEAQYATLGVLEVYRRAQRLGALLDQSPKGAVVLPSAGVVTNAAAMEDYAVARKELDVATLALATSKGTLASMPGVVAPEEPPSRALPLFLSANAPALTSQDILAALCRQGADPPRYVVVVRKRNVP